MRKLIRPLAADCTAAACPVRTRPPEQHMEYHDKVLKCADCGAEFVFTAGEQMFFADKGFKNEPKRCKTCKANRAQGNETGSGNVQRVGEIIAAVPEKFQVVVGSADTLYASLVLGAAGGILAQLIWRPGWRADGSDVT